MLLSEHVSLSFEIAISNLPSSFDFWFTLHSYNSDKVFEVISALFKLVPQLFYGSKFSACLLFGKLLLINMVM